jgi:AraC-like DNA-binding protein
MNNLLAPAPPALKKEAELKTLVENRSVYSLDNFELNIFETHQRSENVSLCFNSLVFTTMLRGKKVMHLPNQPAFDYLPGESVLVKENEVMRIDFPEADRDNPTQCLALAIRNETIRETMERLNDKYPKAEKGDNWHIDLTDCHLNNTREITDTVDRLVKVTMEDNGEKDLLADFVLHELLIRLMQTQARRLLIDNCQQHLNNHRFASVVQYIQDNLADKLTVEKLSNMACMSKPNFFRSFKRELGITPVEYIIQERLKLAKRLLSDPRASLFDVCYRSGFNSTNYFHILFKKYEGLTPKAYQTRFLRN